MNQIDLPSALVVCTLNRPAGIQALLEFLGQTPECPRLIVIVDASEDSATSEVTQSARGLTSLNIVYLRSKIGAAHQKNVGLNFLEANDVGAIEVVHFLDDDVLPESDYFATVLALFRERSDAVVIGGYDRTLSAAKTSFIRNISLLSSGVRSGVILTSGICLVPFPKSKLEQVSFVPGGMLSLRGNAARSLRYDGRIRIYGDEVEFQLRASLQGSIYSSSVLPVTHKSETIAKDSQRVEQGYTDGFRWALAIQNPKLVKKFAVIYTTLILVIGELALWVGRRNHLAKTRALGHMDFLLRLARGEPVQQYVEHEGSGPRLGARRI
jgi:GT2 family glycosyltransferase